jgi:hypothetical protein
MAIIYKDGFKVPLTKLEGLLYSIFLGVICNLGLLLSLTDCGLRWKKLTLIILLLAAASSWFIFYLPSVNPMTSVSDEHWLYVRTILSFSCLGFVLFVMTLVGMYKK